MFIFSVSKLLLNAASYDGEIWHADAWQPHPRLLLVFVSIKVVVTKNAINSVTFNSSGYVPGQSSYSRPTGGNGLCNIIVVPSPDCELNVDVGDRQTDTHRHRLKPPLMMRGASLTIKVCISVSTKTLSCLELASSYVYIALIGILCIIFRQNRRYQTGSSWPRWARKYNSFCETVTAIAS